MQVNLLRGLRGVEELKRVYYRLLQVAEGGKARTWRSVTGLVLDGKGN